MAGKPTIFGDFPTLLPPVLHPIHCGRNSLWVNVGQFPTPEHSVENPYFARAPEGEKSWDSLGTV
jgi:hypothetical protein